MEEYLYADMSLSEIYAKLSKSKRSMIMKPNPVPLQLSLFANQDAFNGISLHDLYNRLSKANKTPAWQRKEGQNPKGGLNAKGRASAKAEGHNLKPPVKSGDNPRRASFLARMGNSPGPEYDEHGKPTRLLLSLQAWGASSKADAKRKAKAISARLKMSKAGTVSYDIINSSDEDDRLNWRQPDLTNEHNTELPSADPTNPMKKSWFSVSIRRFE